MTTNLVPARITEKRPFLCLAEKRFLAKNLFFSASKNHPKFAKRHYLDIYLGKGNFFVYTTLPGHGVQLKLYAFLGPKTLKTLVFCHRTPNFVKGPFGALGEMVHFAPWDLYFDFLFPSYGRFRKKKTQTHQKVLPHPTDRVRQPVTALAHGS